MIPQRPSSTPFPYTTLFRSRPTMVCTKGSQLARVSKSQKTGPSSDCRLQLACMKPESLVIAGQHTAVNVFLSLVHTARQATDRKSTRLNSSHMSISYAVFCLNDPATTVIYTLSLHDALPISSYNGLHKGKPARES